VVGRAESVARLAQVALGVPAAGTRRAKAEADFLVERVTRLGEICRLGETLLDMLLGQLTLDVGRFRDVLKVAPQEDEEEGEPESGAAGEPRLGRVSKRMARPPRRARAGKAGSGD